MKGFFTLELLLLLYLIPYLLFIFDTETPPLLREQEVLAQDAAQMIMYGFSPEDIPLEGMRMWVDGDSVNDCPYRFRYCSSRIDEGGEKRICLAECLQ